MKLLTKEILRKLPRLYATEKTPLDKKMAIVKFFTPWTNWTWFGFEYDGEDRFFGLVFGHEKEWGYFSLSELQSIRGPFGLRIERDMWFRPTPATKLIGE